MKQTKKNVKKSSCVSSDILKKNIKPIQVTPTLSGKDAEAVIKQLNNKPTSNKDKERRFEILRRSMVIAKC